MPPHFVTVAIEDAPGSMGEASELLSEAGVNILAFVVDTAGARFLTTEAEAAVEALNTGGYTSLAVEAIEVVLPDQRGELARLGVELGRAGVNILSSFGVTSNGEGRIFLRVDQKAKALAVLDRLGVLRRTPDSN